MNRQSVITSWRIVLVIALLLGAAPATWLGAQGQVFEVAVPQGKVDYSAFPTVAVRAIVSDDARGRVPGLTAADFALSEDGDALPVTVDDVQVGVQLVFVLDASLDTRQNGATGYTRLEEAKQVVYTFAESYMAEGMDQVAVLAPLSSTEIQKVAPLPEDTAAFTPFRNTVRDGTYLYEIPQGISATPLNDLVSRALAQLQAARSTLFQAVIVISDGIDVISDREVADIVRTANTQNVPIYTIIFGPANNWGGQAESNMKRLSLDTYGDHYRLASEGRKPTPLDELIGVSLEPLYARLTSQREQYQLTYTSKLYSAGSHELLLETGGKSARVGFSINVRPPQVIILQPTPGTQITRRTDDPRMPVQDIEPRTQVVDFEVNWPDGYPRQVDKVDLLVDGVVASESCVPPCSQIIWNLTSLQAGSHSIRVRVRDVQGMQSESDELRLSITVITPTPVPTPTPTPMPTPTPVVVVACEDQYSGITGIVRCNPEVWSLGALVVSLLALVLVVILVRRPPKVISSVVNKVKEITEPFFVDRDKARATQDVKAYLVVLEGDDPTRPPIELVGENIRLGRDEQLAQVVLNDRSVSRLHARISNEMDRKGGERFMMYDEGSTSGSYVNYEQVGINGQWLQHDDIINLGRVRLQFKLKSSMPAAKGKGSVLDQTIPMQAIFPGKTKQEDSTATVIAGSRSVPTPTPAPAERPVDPFATEAYEPAEPEPDLESTQPMVSPGSVRPTAPPPPPPIDDQDAGGEISTQPYVPMDFD